MFLLIFSKYISNAPRNEELLQLIDGEDIVKFIKPQRLRWIDHVIRIDQDRAPKLVLDYTP